MHSVSSVHTSAMVTHARTQTANRATTDPIPDVSIVDAVDLRSRLDGGEALQKQAEQAGVESEEGPSTDQSVGASLTAGPMAPPGNSIGAPLSGRSDRAAPGSGTPAPSHGLSGRDASRAIEGLATTMAVETATVRQSIDDGSLSQLLAQNGVQSTIGMLFNTRL